PTVTLSSLNDLSVNEGSTHTYSYTISDPGQDTVTGVTTSCSGTGAKVGGSDSFTNSGGSFQCSFADGPNSSTVSAAATDSDSAAAVSHGLSAPDSKAVHAVQSANVTPTVAPPANRSSYEGASHSFDLGSFSDPGPDSPWMVSIDWGDRSPVSSFSVSATGSL